MIISSIEKKLRNKSQESQDIAERIKIMAVALGKALKLPKSEMDDLILLALFQNIGKVAIKDSILSKKTKLKSNEKGSKIPIIARIIAIVNAYDVMVYGRHYKKPVLKEEAIKELKKCLTSHWYVYYDMLTI
ncbi:MAG: hypothetical protein L6405_03640 [Actinomycetia bacterium]|nr:hypothetical protein [Actinomycetes bacterium]